MNTCLGVVSADHFARGVSLGIAQIGHGKRAGLARMHAADVLIYHSPVTRLGHADRLQTFTTIGPIDDEDSWQADEGDFKPYRRRVTHREAHSASLAEVRRQLDLTSGPSWGYQPRRGLIALTEHGARVLCAAMVPG